MPKGPENTASY